jgi:transcriptional regulator with XRE-family HTH domain
MKKNKIKEIREKAGISCEELARLTKISKSQIYNINRGTTKNITIKNLKKIAKALKVSINELV